MTTFSFTGVSGRKYEFALIPDDPTTLPRQGGYFILAAGNATDPTPIFISKSRGIRQEISELKQTPEWLTITDIYGASLIYFQSIDAQDREGVCEYDDLISSYKPPANRSHGTGDRPKSVR